MKLSGVVVLGWLMSMCFCFSLQEMQAGSEYYGNLTEQQKQSIRDAITVVSYKTTDVVEIAQYVGDTLDRLWGSSWQTFVFGSSCTQSQVSSSTMFNNRWAVFNNY
jgi:hypothetical protein